MANKYAGTKTEANLMAAFAGESQARNQYTYFASKAKKEGFEQIAALFLKTADNEKEHAKMWYKELHGIGDTAQNLKKAAEGENYEWTDMYASFAQTAEEEGSVWLPRSSAITRSAIAHCLQMWNRQRFLPRKARLFGSAATVAISTLARKHPSCAPPAPILRAILRSTQRIIKKKGQTVKSLSQNLRYLEK